MSAAASGGRRRFTPVAVGSVSYLARQMSTDVFRPTSIILFGICFLLVIDRLQVKSRVHNEMNLDNGSLKILENSNFSQKWPSDLDRSDSLGLVTGSEKSVRDGPQQSNRSESEKWPLRSPAGLNESEEIISDTLAEPEESVPGDKNRSDESQPPIIEISNSSSSPREKNVLVESPHTEKKPSIVPNKESAPAISPEIIHEKKNEGENVDEALTDELYKMWERTYALTEKLPPRDVSPKYGWNITGTPESYPHAPHLEDCQRKHEFSVKSEMHADGGKLPEWATGKAPSPPWVLGSDDQNLAYTRHVQTVIWKNQFPPNCNDPSLKFALVNWSSIHGHGLGSALHIFSTRFAMVLKAGRIFVPFPKSLSRADHEDCKGELRGSFECFFFSLTSKECESVAMKLWNERDVTKGEDPKRDRVVLFNKYKRKEKAFMAGLKGRPWRERPVSIEVFGDVLKIVDSDKDVTKVNGRPFKAMTDRSYESNWWHSQAVRFALRWPSLYTCQAINKVRHRVYGWETSRRIVESRIWQHTSLAAGHLNEDDTDVEIVETNRAGKLVARKQKRMSHSDEADILRSVTINGSVLETELWWNDEPYLPRPIVSIHVRQGDKGLEMQIFSFKTHMWLAERLKRRSPNLKHVWLSTEMESVIQESKKFPDWTFLYTNNTRQDPTKSMRQYTLEVGETELTVLSFANLIIASQCDYFVGALGSNWNRLINELRLTNGRMKAGVLAVNVDEE